MGERFSWDKLLKRDKKSDNTIEVNPNQTDMGPVVHLGRTDDLSSHKKASPPVSAPEPLTSEVEPSNTAPKAPLVIDWDQYRSQTNQDLMNPVVDEVVLAEPVVSEPPVMGMPPVAPVEPVVADSLPVEPVAPVQAPIDTNVPTITETTRPVIGWDDVELTPREQASQVDDVSTTPTEAPVSQFNSVQPLIENSTPPPIPQFESESVANESEPEAPQPPAVPTNYLAHEFSNLETSLQNEPVESSVPAEEPKVDVAPAPVNSGIPDIFAKAMGLIPESAPSAPATPPASPSSVWTSSQVPAQPVDSTEPPMSVPVAETAQPAEPSPSMAPPAVTEYSSPNPVVAQQDASEQQTVASGEEPVSDYQKFANPQPESTSIPEQYIKADGPIDLQQARDKKLGELLVENRLITQRQLDRALERQAQTREKLGAILIAMQTMSERRLLQVLSAQKGVSPWHLEEDHPTEEALKLVPEDMCRVFQVLPVAIRGDLLLLAMRDPEDREAIENVRQQTQMRIEPVLADEARLAYSIDNAYGVVKARRAVALDKYVAEAMAGLEQLDLVDADKVVFNEEQTEPVSGLVDHIIEEAIRLHASDIHFEPREEIAEIRYRLDGQLMKMREIPSELMPLVVARIKIMGDLDLADLKNPQDGRSQFKFGSNNVGLRISALPNFHGTRIVMRVLDKAVGLRAMDRLGFEAQNLTMFRELIAKPYGLFLVTGPTGSGKTTTLYAAVEELKQTATNIMTCEDPVEYDISGINQSEVQERSGLTFGKQLKAIMRQDPDVVLIGEIRDAETAEIALRAATSGHMVLATMHCNDAAAAVPRLFDMGVDAHTLSSALVGTLSQRLIRVLCPKCKKSTTPTEEENLLLTKNFGLENVEQVWHACGCDDCMNTGYKGRTAVHEVLPVTEEVTSLIENRAKPEELKKAASYYGYLPMQQDAITRVLSGETTVEEAMRVLAIDTIEKRSAPRTIQVPKAG